MFLHFQFQILQLRSTCPPSNTPWFAQKKIMMYISFSPRSPGQAEQIESYF